MRASRAKLKRKDVCKSNKVKVDKLQLGKGERPYEFNNLHY